MKHGDLDQALGHGPADKRMDILRLIGATGSISQAAREAGVSYKAAWQAVHTLTNLAGVALVDRTVGGSGGGGARLTPAGEQLLEAARQMDTARRDVLTRLGGAAAGAVSGAGLRTSMRNHLPGVVAELQRAQPRDPMVRVVLTLGGGATLASQITQESAELLALAPGLPVLALCKATAVSVHGGADAPHAPGKANLLAGRVTRLSRGALRDEVTLAMAGGLQLVGFADKPNRLRTNSLVMARIDESAVVVARP